MFYQITSNQKKIMTYFNLSKFSTHLFTLLLFTISFTSTQLFAQAIEGNVWKSLQDVTFKTKNDGKYNTDYPVFGKGVKALNGKEVTIKGYVLPLELGRPNTFILSQLPYNMCFFCGGAGPETVIEVNSKEEIPYSIKPVGIKGKLRLNATDYNHLMYILDEAVKIEVN